MKKIRFLALVCVVLLTLTGCSLDVESYLYPPAVGGQQQAVQEALETYLSSYRQSGYPMVSHSDAYRKAYSPAYRIIFREKQP